MAATYELRGFDEVSLKDDNVSTRLKAANKTGDRRRRSVSSLLAGKISLMFLSLLAGVGCALGQHFFYRNLEGKPPPESSWDIAGGVSKQKVNIAVGNTLAFFTKAFLAMAVATAHDQISWKTIKGRPAEIGVIDSLFTSREDWTSALNLRMWLKMPFAAFLMLLFWLLQVAPLITPSSLTIKSAWVNGTDTTRVPRVDFTSMNFASMSWGFTDVYRALDKTEWQTTTLTYYKPQHLVQRAVQGSLISNDILSISAPSINTSWSLDFHGPAVKCKALHNSTDDSSRTRIFTQFAEAWHLGGMGTWMSYLAWLPEGSGVNSSLPFTQTGNFTFVPRTAIAGGEPLSMYIMVPPSSSPPNPNSNITVDGIANYLEANALLWQIELQNVTYRVDFSYPNGAQEINIKTSDSLNDVNYFSGFDNFVISNNVTWDVNMTKVTLDQSVVETFAYQSVMDAFSSMFIGNATILDVSEGNSTAIKLNLITSMAMTPLIQAKELRNLSEALNVQNSNLGNVAWNGKSVDQSRTTSRSVSDLIEEMFRNATVSLMNEAALNPNYDSEYAPSDVEIRTWTSRSVYAYSTSTLLITYGIAVVISTVCVVIGTIVIITSNDSYTSEFSTFLRVGQNVHLSGEIAPQDTGGQDPLPPYVKKMVVSFPKRNEAGLHSGSES